MSEDRPSCCPSNVDRPDRGAVSPDQHSSIRRTEPATDTDDRVERMVQLPGGTFEMGTDDDVGFPADGEGPARSVTVSSFYIDRYAVTNAQFLAFVQDSGYETDAERFGWSFVFEDFLPEAARPHVMDRVPDAPWWVAVEGASWLRPEGPGSNVFEDDRTLHPVTQVSWQDAMAYADWAGVRLPTEAEWEYAARGGLTGKRYPWGDELEPDGSHRCNIWQGEFPQHNTGDDGYLGTAPVNAFEPNGHDLYNVSGNVWEWCADWFSADYHTTPRYDYTDPSGPEEGDERVMRGGSFLCHQSWCNRYRVAARSKNTPDSGTGNIGFRCVVDVE